MRIHWFFIWTNLNPYHPRMLVPRLVEIGSVVLEKRIFLISSMHFPYFVIISPWKRVGPFIWTNLNPLDPKMLLAKFGWNWLSGSWEEDFLISSKYFPCNYLPLKKGGDLHLYKLESPSPKDALWQVWLKLVDWFWRKRFFKFRQCIFTIS